ncbi:MAG: TIGR04211 family SH3 domain-containing protein [Ketobacteraceae bacterium]|nr:TIGR04211 family SH3 domain-containing protein [Ketobacteraceae bacterium]
MLFASAQAAFAKTAYIHDVLRVDMRAGPTNGYKILNFLPSGTRLEVLGQTDDGDWTKVQHGSQTGWLQSQYLTYTPIAADRLEAANRRLEKLEKENVELREKLAETEARLNELQSIRSKLDSSNSTLQEELENLQRISKNAVNTERSYRKLQESTELLKVELENLKAENAILGEDNLKEGIKWGIIAVIAGALMAIMIPKMSGRKRRSEW